MTKAELFAAIGEPYAMGLFSDETKSIFCRHCAAYTAWFQALAPTVYHTGDLLYPHGADYLKTDCALRPQYAMTYVYDGARMRQKCLDSGFGEEAIAACDACDAFFAENGWPGGWLHGSPNYHRIIMEGLASYRERAKHSAGDADFRCAVIGLLDAIEGYLSRCVDYLRTTDAPTALIDAMTHVPFAPAQTYYEGLVAWNWIFYLDGCDNLGCIDRGLGYLYRGEDLTPVIAQLFENIDAVDMWSCTLGPEYNAVTEQALRAVEGKRRPLLELRVTADMPHSLWKLASEMLCSGSTNPSFYNERGIHDMIAAYLPQIPEESLGWFCGCGCTETNLEGLTRAGGTDDDVNLLAIFERYLHRALPTACTFEEFYEGLCEVTCKEINALLDRLSSRYHYYAEHLPNPMRTLFFDDCIDRGKDYNAGGARYTWTMNSDSGLVNVFDSLAAVKTLVYDEKRFTPEEFLANLAKEDDAFIAILKSCPCYGTDNAEVDQMAAAYTKRIYSVYQARGKDDFIDAFTLTEHQFLRYEMTGAAVGPTPDGRKRGDPTCDSVAALRGKAVKGPTAMLSSAAKLPQHLAMGMTVLNLTVAKRIAEDPVLLRALVLGYFEKGGLQVQVTVTSAETLQDAMIHPESHEDLIVRVGGYSEYFNRLSPALKKTVLERNIHDL